MSKTNFEYLEGGRLRDRYGRMQFALRELNVEPAKTDTPVVGGYADSDGREQVVLYNLGEAIVGAKTLTEIATVATAVLGPAPTGGDDKASVEAALAANTRVQLREGTYKFAGGLSVPENATLIGMGRGTILSYTGEGTFITMHTEARLRDLLIEATTTKYTLIAMKGVFHSHITGCTIKGNNLGGATKPEQTGITFSENAGDSTLALNNFENLGTAILANSETNYVTNCMFITCYRGIWANAGSFSAGMGVNGCTFTSSATATLFHTNIEVNTNAFHFVDCWFEGCEKAIIFGTGTEGPTQASVVNCTVAATTACITIAKGTGEVLLQTILFGKDGAAKPAELTIENKLGVAMNVKSAQEAEVPFLTTFPSEWMAFYPKYGTLAVDQFVTRKGSGEYGITPPASRPAAIASPAAELAPLKKAVDEIREVLKNKGSTS